MGAVAAVVILVGVVIGLLYRRSARKRKAE